MRASHLPVAALTILILTSLSWLRVHTFIRKSDFVPTHASPVEAIQNVATIEMPTTTNIRAFKENDSVKPETPVALIESRQPYTTSNRSATAKKSNRVPSEGTELPTASCFGNCSRSTQIANRMHAFIPLFVKFHKVCHYDAHFAVCITVLGAGWLWLSSRYISTALSRGI